MLRAYAQLLRLPNVFTAWADIFMGWMVAGGLTRLPYLLETEYPELLRYYVPDLSLLICTLGASGFLYCAGMVWNDYFDVEQDTRERPWRPIPSGRISKRTAACTATALMFGGVGFAAVCPTWSDNPMERGYRIFTAIILVSMILWYDANAKRGPHGPIVMGSCRMLNVWLGLLAGEGPFRAFEQSVHITGVVLTYIVGVTWLARKEAGQSQRWALLGAAALIAGAIILAVFLPEHRWSIEAVARSWRQGITQCGIQQGIPVESVEVRLFPYLLMAWSLGMAVPIYRAIRDPSPQRVQTAVKWCILGLIGLDALMAFCVVGWPGLLILLLLPPALILGKWIYST